MANDGADAFIFAKLNHLFRAACSSSRKAGSRQGEAATVSLGNRFPTGPATVKGKQPFPGAAGALDVSEVVRVKGCSSNIHRINREIHKFDINSDRTRARECKENHSAGVGNVEVRHTHAAYGPQRRFAMGTKDDFDGSRVTVEVCTQKTSKRAAPGDKLFGSGADAHLGRALTLLRR